MIALDTNVVVRFLVEDDRAQAARARAVVAAAGDRELFLSQLVLCEVVWVLASAYAIPRATIIEVMQRLLRTRQLTVEDLDGSERALEDFAAGRGDFADYVIRERGRGAGCTGVLTFDKELLREDGFESP